MSMSPETTWNRKLFVDLSGFTRNVTSQFGEDGIIEAIFERCQPKYRWCVDIGASDGYMLSNTWSLIQRGWKSLQVEAIEATHKDGLLFSGYQKIVERYRDNPSVYCLNKKVGRNDLDNILSQFPIPQDFDFMSLDIDSYDAEVWENLMKYRPSVIAIECNEAIEDFAVSYYNVGDPKNAASVGYLNQIAEKKGYKFICATRCNAFYIDWEFSRPIRN